MPQCYSVESLTTETSLQSVGEDWNRLSEACELPNAFATHDWFQVWYQYYSLTFPNLQSRPFLLVLRQGDSITGVAPFVLRRSSRFGVSVRKVEFVARQADYNDFIVGEDPAGQCQAAVDFLDRNHDQWDLIDLRGLRETDLPLIEHALKRARLEYRILPEECCPYLPIDAPWTEIMARRDRSPQDARIGLHELRKKQRRLATEGLNLRMIECPHDEPGLLDKLILVEKEKRVDGKSAIPFMARYPEVVKSLFDTLGRRGWMYVALMEMGERPLAWQLGFRCGRKLWNYLTAYDHSFTRFSPGTMLIPAILEYGFSRGYEEFDFLRGEEPYKLMWSNASHKRSRVVIWSQRRVSHFWAFAYLSKIALLKL